MSKKILIIDDEPELLEVVSARVSKAGYEVVQASDGKSGLEKIGVEKPDLVLLDLLMPGLDGFEVMRHKNENSEIKGIPVILFTASIGMGSMEEKTREVGATDYITKPFDSKELIRKIKMIIGE